MLYVGIYPQIYPPTILRLGIVFRDGLPRPTGTLPSSILKLEKYCPTSFPVILWVMMSFTFQSLYSKHCIPTPSPPKRRMIDSGWWFELIDLVLSVGESQTEKIKIPFPESSSWIPRKRFQIKISGLWRDYLRSHQICIHCTLQVQNMCMGGALEQYMNFQERNQI